LVKLAGFVEGSTRMQKLVFLVSQNVKELKTYDFYHDWEASKFGPFSKDLSDDVIEAIQSNILAKYPRKNDAGYNVDCFILTDEGMKIADPVVKDNPKVISKIQEILQQYNKAALMSLLHDVYYQYPQFTSGSTIKSEVVGKTGFVGTSLDPTYDEPQE
jgi:uncharacterized protein YwgA